MTHEEYIDKITAFGFAMHEKEGIEDTRNEDWSNCYPIFFDHTLLAIILGFTDDLNFDDDVMFKVLKKLDSLKNGISYLTEDEGSFVVPKSDTLALFLDMPVTYIDLCLAVMTTKGLVEWKESPRTTRKEPCITPLGEMVLETREADLDRLRKSLFPNEVEA